MCVSHNIGMIEQSLNQIVQKIGFIFLLSHIYQYCTILFSICQLTYVDCEFTVCPSIKGFACYEEVQLEIAKDLRLRKTMQLEEGPRIIYTLILR